MSIMASNVWSSTTLLEIFMHANTFCLSSLITATHMPSFMSIWTSHIMTWSSTRIPLFMKRSLFLANKNHSYHPVPPHGSTLFLRLFIMCHCRPCFFVLYHFSWNGLCFVLFNSTVQQLFPHLNPLESMYLISLIIFVDFFMSSYVLYFSIPILLFLFLMLFSYVLLKDII